MRADALVVLVEHFGQLFHGLRTLREQLDEFEPDFVTEGLAYEADLLVEAVLAFEIAQGISPLGSIEVIPTARRRRGAESRRSGFFENTSPF